MADNNIGREPNPTPVPEATGSVDQATKLKLVGGLAILVLVILILSFFFGRSKTPVVEQRLAGNGTGTQDTDRQQREKEAQARHEAEAERRRQEIDRLNRANHGDAPPPAGNWQQTTQLQPAFRPVAAEDDYRRMLREAAFADNMVDLKRTTDGRAHESRASDSDSVRGGGEPPRPPGSDNRDLSLDNGDSRAQEKPKQPRLGIPPGTIIECTLVNELIGDFTGPVIAQVANNVIHPETGSVKIPQGARFLGESKQVNAQNQQRLAVTFDTLLVGTTVIDLSAIGLDQLGATALKDKTNNHYLSTFGAAGAIGAIGGLAQIGNGNYGGLNGYDSGQQFRNGVSQGMAQSSAQILNRFLNRLPNISIRPGTIIQVYLKHGV